MNLRLIVVPILSCAFAVHTLACELCAIYSASNARGESSSGFLFTMSEQFIPFRTTQINGREITVSNPDHLDRSITHLVPGCNFSPRYGVSLNVPLVYRSFQRTDFRYAYTAPRLREREKAAEFGLGDAALIGRAMLFQKTGMNCSVVVNLLGGVKCPTGDTDRLQDEVEQTVIYNRLLPPNTPHDPLGHSIASVHQHQLSAGSGSFDGIFGVTLNSRWQRAFFNSQFQYYLRTRGEPGFQFGDELRISGGPGAYLLLKDTFTLSLQANATFEWMARDRISGRLSDRTGWTA